MAEQPAQAYPVLSFGRFVLSPGERLLTHNGVPVELGARTLDTLVALASRPNHVVGKRELLAQVWPDVTVEEGSLRFHVAALRKALGDGKDGARYIATLAGRGYCFVAPVTRSAAPKGASPEPGMAPSRPTSLPARLARMVGREEDVVAISATVAAARFVTILGPGGVGKTTVAVAAAHALLPEFDGAVQFVDFSVLGDARMVPDAVAPLLGLSIQSEDAVPSLIAFLRDRRILLVLDNCEHVVDGVAHLAVRLFLAAPGLHVLATSREALRVDGEQVHRLLPLAVPPEGAALTAEATLGFPAAQLFVERARAGGARLDGLDADAAIVARICRKLDGMALAIELAAGRVEAYGLPQIARLIDQRFALLWPGQRTAPARQKTLQATLAWSYGLLSDAERTVFRRVAVFVGTFSLEAALAVVADREIDDVGVAAGLDSLVDKSMIVACPVGGVMRYRLLDTARGFATLIGADDPERHVVAGRHAAYCLRWLGMEAAEGRLDPALRASHLVELTNVRGALAWCFDGGGDVGLGVDLAAAAAPAFFAMSLVTECQMWSQRAIAALNDAALGGRAEMRLQAALGLSLMWTAGNSNTTFAALNRSMALAAEQGDTATQILLLTPLHVFHMRIGDFRAAMRTAEQVRALARATQDGRAIALSSILLGYSYHFVGDLSGARRELEAALRHDIGAAPAGGAGPLARDPMSAPILALAWSAAPSALARTLWLLGDPDMAMRYVTQTLREAARADHPVTLLVALMHAISVLIWNGDFDEAAAQIARLRGHAQSYALASHAVLARCFEGQLAIAGGDAEHGAEVLGTALRELRALRYEMFTTSFNLSLVRAFMATGRFVEGMALVDATIRSVEANGDFCYLPELLRVRARLIEITEGLLF